LGLILEKVREELGGWKRDYQEPFWLMFLQNESDEENPLVIKKVSK
jgi:hypothetical protein